MARLGDIRETNAQNHSDREGSRAVVPPAKPVLSIVSPVYRGEVLVEPLVEQISERLGELGVTYEILLVDDGSPDKAWQNIVSLTARYPRLRGIKLSRNFGQHQAITAGLTHARGEYVVVMDCDLQDDPRFIGELLGAARRGADIVFTRNRERQHPRVKNFFARIFHRLLNALVADRRLESDPNQGAYTLLSRKAVDAFLRIEDYHRHYLSILRWLGFSTAVVEVEHGRRYAGESSYTFRNLVRLALDGVISQSSRLLEVSILVGAGSCALAILTAAFIVFKYFMYGFKEGWTSVVVLILLSTGIILMFMGVIGIYLGKTFEQTKRRPLFLVDEVVGGEDVTK